MGRARSRSPRTALPSPLVTWQQDGIGSHSNYGTKGCVDHLFLEPNGSLPMDRKGFADLQGARLGLWPSIDTDGRAEDQVDLVDHILLEECHRLGALAELRVAFNDAWMSRWGCRPEPHIFFSWFFEALNDEEPAWPPVPGCELRGKATEAELKAPAVACITLWLPTKKKLPAGYRSDMKTPELRAVAAAAFAETAIELATDIREEWLRRYQLIIKQSRADRLQIISHFKAADGNTEASTRLALLGKLPSYLRPSKLKLFFDMHASYLEKLFLRFDQHGAVLPGAGPFRVRCWQLMARYQTIFGNNDELAPMQSAVTKRTMLSLVQEFGVCHELFASPLNCTLPGYCSLFEDIDKFFGSSGSFFQFCQPEGYLVTCGGSYECNPPFNNALFEAVVPLLLQALTLCKLPLSIALVLPGWNWSKPIRAAATSHFCRGRVDIGRQDNVYINGLQHCCKKKDLVWCHDPKNRGIGWSSVVLLLQNNAGAAQFPISEENLANHRASWGQT